MKRIEQTYRARIAGLSGVGLLFLCIFSVSLLLNGHVCAQEAFAEGAADEAGDRESLQMPDLSDIEGAGETLTFNLRRVPMDDFFSLITQKTGIRFIVKPEVKEIEISAFLPGVRVSTALEAMLKVHGLQAVEIEPGILLVERKAEVEEEPAEPPVEIVMELIHLKYLDADDLKKSLEPFMSELGMIAVAERSGYRELEGTASEDERRRKVESRMLIVRERADILDLMRPIIDSMDVRPEQILISAHIVEVKHDKIRDLGVDWESSRGDLLGSISLGAWAEPDVAVAEPGLGLHFRRLDGRDRGELQAFFRILEEKADANILSSPRLLAMDSQECRIMVGERFPILLTDVDRETGQRTSSLDYYEDVGMQLRVIPRIQHNGDINMIIRPSISAQTDWVEARGEGGVLLARYPVIDTRETETQVTIEDGQTIVIGGLITEETAKTIRGVPLLKDIPILGYLFRREVTTSDKIDLLIFLSADIIRSPGESTEERFRRMGEGVARVYANRLELRGYPERGGRAVDLTGGAPYNIREDVEVTAVAETAFEFEKWTGHTGLITEGSETDPDITVTMKGEDAWLTANFRRIGYMLTLGMEPQGEYSARGPHKAGSKITVHAEPSNGYVFRRWVGDTRFISEGSSREPVVTVTLPSRDIELVAEFEPVNRD